MRQGFYEVLVCPTSNPTVPFDETVIEGKTYIHAEPGEYEVRVRVLPECQHLVQGQLLGAKIEIDGEPTNCLARMTSMEGGVCQQGVHGKFFKKNKVIHFAFKQPAIVEDTGDTIDDNQTLGTIKVTIHECELCQTEGASFNNSGDLTPTHTVAEGKKFWKQPSLLTGGGTIAERPVYTSPTFFRALREIYAIDLLYHSSSTIRILETIANHGGEHPATSAASSSSSAGKKRRRADNEVIDLTKE